MTQQKPKTKIWIVAKTTIREILGPRFRTDYNRYASHPNKRKEKAKRARRKQSDGKLETRMNHEKYSTFE